MSDFKLITSDQLAQILGFSKKSIYVLASRGSSSLPPAFHVGKALRWHPHVVQNWIDQRAGLSAFHKTTLENAEQAKRLILTVEGVGK